MRLVVTKRTNRFLDTQDSERGFSLIELMVAIAVITFGLVSIVGVSAYVSRANSTSNTVSVLATAAQDQADILRGAIWSTAFQDPKLTVGGHLDYASSDANHRVLIADTPAGVLNVSWKVVDGPATTGDMRTVTIRVVQVDAPDRLAEGFSVTIIVARS
jgi:prepilin-type N-terminal cleavage/methylation domain-containing protein